MVTLLQVKLGSGLFPKWAQLFVSVAGGVLVCKEAPWAKDALAPASLLQVPSAVFESKIGSKMLNRNHCSYLQAT